MQKHSSTKLLREATDLRVIMSDMNILKKFLPKIIAEAHCDVPCGIYDPTAAKVAAKTVERMAMQLEELKMPEDMNDAHSRLEYTNAVTRRIQTKEEHAETCKRELSILWSDYFKPEHLEKYPDLHDRFWKALKLCSKNKQNIDSAAAKELTAAVDGIAKIFYETKNDSGRYEAFQQITDKLF